MACGENTGEECCTCENRTPKCFPAAARVFLESGKLVKISELPDWRQSTNRWTLGSYFEMHYIAILKSQSFGNYTLKITQYKLKPS